MRLGDLDEALRMIKDSRKDNPYVSNVNAIAWRMAHDSAISCVEAVPTIDAVPVMRCRDCRHWNEFMNGQDGKMLGDCKIVGAFRDDDDFCSYGERKEV